MRFLHGHRARRHHQRRQKLKRAGGLAAVFAVFGPGILAGLSDDDPAGITTYSIMGADHGYRLLWVLLASTLLLILFHGLAARLGVITGKGLLALVRERHGERAAVALLVPLVLANIGTLVAEFAGVAAAAGLAGIPRGPAVLAAAILVCVLVLGASFHRVEHVLLVLSAVFVAYIGAGVLARPDIGEATHGLLVPGLGSGSGALLAAVACIGTTLAPWGLTFMQSYVADKRLEPSALKYERIDVATGAVMTGVIGAFIIVASAATLHPAGRSIDSAADAALALEPLAGRMASLLFGGGLLGAALLAAAVVPMATAYSVSEAFGHEGRLDDPPRKARVFYGSFVVSVAVAAGIVVVPSVPLIPVIFLSQVLNAVLLLPLLIVLRRLVLSRELMGDHVLRPTGRVLSLVSTVAVAVSVVLLGVESL